MESTSQAGRSDYGDATAEYEVLREGVAMVERADLSVARMYGRDPVRMLNGLITNDLARAAPDRAVYGAVLTPKGRVISDLYAWTIEIEGSTELRLLFPASAREGLAAHLTKYVPPLFARWEVLDREVLGLYGPGARELATSKLAMQVPETVDQISRGQLGEDDLTLVATGILGDAGGYEIIVEGGAGERVRRALIAAGATPAGFTAFEAARVRAGRPRHGRELTEETLPAEAYETTGLMERAISFTKGCYTGQEVVVRIAHRGHVNKHLRGLELEEPEQVDTPLFRPSDGKEVGRITSVAGSPPARRPIALGYVRREISPGETVRAGNIEGTAVRVVKLPFAEN